jgi:putative effector of murein hydrolase LrgA (UPF0299 family)
MNNLFVRALIILLAVAFVVLLYYVTNWVLALLGLNVPDKIITIIFVCVGLIAAITALSGRFDNYWKS